MAAGGDRVYSILADSAREELGEGLGKMEGVVRKVLAEGIGGGGCQRCLESTSEGSSVRLELEDEESHRE